MLKHFISIWALFFGISLFTIGNGLQGTLLGVRGALEGFSIGNLGAIMSSYYGGFLLGSLYTQKLVLKVGHIRVFAAFASLASIAILAHTVILNPFIWGLIRLVSGFSFAGLFVVTESWLNDQSTNENRGRILSIYMAINHGGFFIGQILLNVAPPGEYSPFILISVLLSFALIPILVTASPSPNFEDFHPLTIKQLYHISPTSLACLVGIGLAHGTVWGMGPVFAKESGFDVQNISLFMGAIILGGFLFQWPIGNLSDKFDRRVVLNWAVWLTGFSAFVCYLIPKSNFPFLLMGVFVLGGFSLPLYSLSIAHANDHLHRHQMVAASSAMVLVYGAGAFMGPLIGSMWMTYSGLSGFFYHLISVHIILGTFLFLRIQASPPVPLEEQESFVAIPPRTSPVIAVLTPEIPDDSLESDTE